MFFCKKAKYLRVNSLLKHTIRSNKNAPNCVVIVWLLYGYCAVRVPKIV